MLSSVYCSPDETATLLVVAEAQVMVPRCPEHPSFADGEMPPFYYVYPMHMDARLWAADQQAFKEWITSESANLTQQTSQTATP